MNKSVGFNQSQRLRTKSDFQSVFDRAFKVSQKYLLALAKSNPNKPGRLGIIISKKVTKKAVSRNQFKRIIRESFRHQQIRLKGFDIIVIARPGVSTLDKLNLRKGIDQLWEKLIQHYQNLSL